MDVGMRDGGEGVFLKYGIEETLNRGQKKPVSFPFPRLLLVLYRQQVCMNSALVVEEERKCVLGSVTVHQFNPHSGGSNQSYTQLPFCIS